MFSTVTCARAREAAEQTAPYLNSQHIYADLNSVSPALKQEVARVISGSGAGFVEAAVMSPVPPNGHRSPMLLGGNAAAAFCDLMTPFGMRLQVISDKVGTAAATKMFRSIIVKGLEALMLECVLASAPYGADERVFSSLSESFPGIDWQRLADYMVSRVVVARRTPCAGDGRGGRDPASRWVSNPSWPRQRRAVRTGARSLVSRPGSVRTGPKTYREALEAINCRRGL